MKIYELKKEITFADYSKQLATLHIQAFPEFFLTQLGHGFLSTLYQGYLEDENSGIIIAESNKGKILGFIAYSKDYSQFFNKLIKKHYLKFVFYSIIAVLHHPSFVKKLLGALKKSEKVKREEKYVELASIAVNPNVSGRGIGSQLVNYLKELIDYKTYAYINLETDADNNKAANIFYQKNGFRLERIYYTDDGRRMNEYHFNY